MTYTTMTIAVQWHTIEKYISNQNKIIKVHLHIKLHERGIGQQRKYIKRELEKIPLMETYEKVCNEMKQTRK